MTPARESTDAQWEAYWAARAKAHRTQAAAHRDYAAALRLNPFASHKNYVDSDAYERLATDCDALAAELETGETA